MALEAIYAFGVLAVEPSGEARRELLRTSAPALAALLGVPDPAMRFAAVRVIGRVFAPRVHDGPIEESLGDAVITALNDPDRAVKSAAMESLGLMRYERGVQALTELFQYYGKGEPAEAALDAHGAHGASGASAPLFTSQLTAKSAALRGIAIEGLARLGDASQLPAIQSALASERGDSLLLAGAFASAMLANAPLDADRRSADEAEAPRPGDQYLVELAPGRSALFTSSCRIPIRGCERTSSTSWPGGDPAALPLVERLLADRDPQVVKAAERAVARLRAICSRKPHFVARRETTPMLSTIVPPSTSRAICSARCSSTSGAASEPAASSSRSRRTSAKTIRRATRRPGRRAATRRSMATRPRLRLSELRHPLSGERRHRGEGIAGGGADSRARAA